jgi:hypothetical protein
MDCVTLDFWLSPLGGSEMPCAKATDPRQMNAHAVSRFFFIRFQNLVNMNLTRILTKAVGF